MFLELNQTKSKPARPGPSGSQPPRYAGKPQSSPFNQPAQPFHQPQYQPPPYAQHQQHQQHHQARRPYIPYVQPEQNEPPFVHSQPRRQYPPADQGARRNNVETGRRGGRDREFRDRNSPTINRRRDSQDAGRSNSYERRERGGMGQRGRGSRRGRFFTDRGGNANRGGDRRQLKIAKARQKVAYQSDQQEQNEDQRMYLRQKLLSKKEQLKKQPQSQEQEPQRQQQSQSSNESQSQESQQDAQESIQYLSDQNVAGESNKKQYIVQAQSQSKPKTESKLIETIHLMCPPLEFKQRLKRHQPNDGQQPNSQQFAIFQLNKHNMAPDPNLAVKKFKRPSPGQIFHDIYIRSPQCLQKVVIHLFTKVLDADTIVPDAVEYSVKSRATFQQIYDYLWNRCRAVTKDITMLGEADFTRPSIVRAAEMIVRFFVLSFNEARPFVTGQKLNKEAMINSMVILEKAYKKIIAEVLQAMKKGIDQCQRKITKGDLWFSPSQAQIISYMMLLSASGHFQFQQKMCSFFEPLNMPIDKIRLFMLESTHMKNALLFIEAIKSKNFIRYFKLLNDPSIGYLTACCALVHLKVVRYQAIKVMATSRQGFPVAKLRRNLGFGISQDDQFHSFLRACNIIKEGVTLNHCDIVVLSNISANIEQYLPSPFQFDFNRRARISQAKDIVKINQKHLQSRAYFIYKDKNIDQQQSKLQLRKIFVDGDILLTQPKIHVAPIKPLVNQNNKKSLRGLFKKLKRRRIQKREKGIQLLVNFSKKYLSQKFRLIKAHKRIAAQEISFFRPEISYQKTQINLWQTICRGVKTHLLDSGLKQFVYKVVIVGHTGNSDSLAQSTTVLKMFTNGRNLRQFKTFVMKNSKTPFTTNFQLVFSSGNVNCCVNLQVNFIKQQDKQALINKQLIRGTDLMVTILKQRADTLHKLHSLVDKINWPRFIPLLIFYDRQISTQLIRVCQGIPQDKAFLQMFAMEYNEYCPIIPLERYVLFSINVKPPLPPYQPITYSQIVQMIDLQLGQLQASTIYKNAKLNQKFQFTTRVINLCLDQVIRAVELSKEQQWRIPASTELDGTLRKLGFSEIEPDNKQEMESDFLKVIQRFCSLEQIVSSGAYDFIKSTLNTKFKLKSWCPMFRDVLQVVSQFITGEVNLPRGWEFELQEEWHSSGSQNAVKGKSFEDILDWTLLQKIRKRRMQNKK